MSPNYRNKTYQKFQEAESNKIVGKERKENIVPDITKVKNTPTYQIEQVISEPLNMRNFTQFLSEIAAGKFQTLYDILEYCNFRESPLKESELFIGKEKPIAKHHDTDGQIAGEAEKESRVEKSKELLKTYVIEEEEYIVDHKGNFLCSGETKDGRGSFCYYNFEGHEKLLIFEKDSAEILNWILYGQHVVILCSDSIYLHKAGVKDPKRIEFERNERGKDLSTDLPDIEVPDGLTIPNLPVFEDMSVGENHIMLLGKEGFYVSSLDELYERGFNRNRYFCPVDWDSQAKDMYFSSDTEAAYLLFPKKQMEEDSSAESVIEKIKTDDIIYGNVSTIGYDDFYGEYDEFEEYDEDDFFDDDEEYMDDEDVEVEVEVVFELGNVNTVKTKGDEYCNYVFFKDKYFVRETESPLQYVFVDNGGNIFANFMGNNMKSQLFINGNICEIETTQGGKYEKQLLMEKSVLEKSVAPNGLLKDFASVENIFPHKREGIYTLLQNKYVKVGKNRANTAEDETKYTSHIIQSLVYVTSDNRQQPIHLFPHDQYITQVNLNREHNGYIQAQLQNITLGNGDPRYISYALCDGKLITLQTKFSYVFYTAVSEHAKDLYVALVGTELGKTDVQSLYINDTKIDAIGDFTQCIDLQLAEREHGVEVTCEYIPINGGVKKARIFFSKTLEEVMCEREHQREFSSYSSEIQKLALQWMESYKKSIEKIAFEKHEHEFPKKMLERLLSSLRPEHLKLLMEQGELQGLDFEEDHD